MHMLGAGSVQICTNKAIRNAVCAQYENMVIKEFSIGALSMSIYNFIDFPKSFGVSRNCAQTVASSFYFYFGGGMTTRA